MIIKRKNERSSRSFRVSELIRKSISKVLVKNELPLDEPFKFPISVTKVEMNSDLKIAYIYVTSHDEINKKDMIQRLNLCKHYLSREITNYISLKYSPKLLFRYDESLLNLLKIEELLQSEKVLKDINNN